MSWYDAVTLDLIRHGLRPVTPSPPGEGFFSVPSVSASIFTTQVSKFSGRGMPRPYTHQRYCVPPLIRSLRDHLPQGKAFLRRTNSLLPGKFIFLPFLFTFHFSLFPLLLKSKNSSPWCAFALHGEVFLSCFGRDYFAYSMALVSRMTLTLIWPGYSNSASIFLAMSRARRIILSSVTSSGFTMIRTSRPAWMA